MNKDLRNDDAPMMEAKVAKLIMPSQEISLTMRRLRTCLNMMSAKIFDFAADPTASAKSKETSKKAKDKVQPWYDAVKVNSLLTVFNFLQYQGYYPYRIIYFSMILLNIKHTYLNLL